ncbi:MAG: RecX family transcriptional regulator [Ardenticatenales bacterium]|nr:RecX family transcriptional regulator [Ardenticatenales bacterium]
MKQITRLVIQQTNKDRVNVYLDGEFAFGLTLDEAVRLKVGQLLSDDDIAALQEEDLYRKAYQRALDYLARRPRSQKELERYLSKKEVADTHIERVCQRLVEVGFLDDLSFARYWIENREAFRPRGAQALRYELRQKGVDETIIAQALTSSEIDETDSAYQVALKYLPRLQKIQDPWQFQQKLAAYLSRRGYNWDTIRCVSDRLKEDARNDSS